MRSGHAVTRVGSYSLIGVVALAALLLPPAPLAAEPAAEAAPKVGDAQIDQVEDATEDLANWLLNVSDAIMRDDWKTVEASLSADVKSTQMPALNTAKQPFASGVSKLAWEAPAGPAATLDRTATIAAWKKVFKRWTSIEDMLFKVKQATWTGNPPDIGEARIFLSLNGIGPSGMIEDLSGWWAMSVDRQADPKKFLITRIAPEAMVTLVPDRAIFSEVARPAGLGRRLPRFGTQGNLSFHWRGASTADVDSDGDLDIYVPAADLSLLYLNQGNGRFEDAAARAGLAEASGGTGSVFFDYDNDGDQDLFVARVGTQLLFENRFVPSGRLQFADVSLKAGVDLPGVGYSASAGDIEGDGDLDVFVANYNLYGTVMPNSWYNATNGKPNMLFVNAGNGTFTQEADRRGLKGTAWSYAASFADYDEDGDQDLYVANDYGTKQLYRNDGRGQFTDVSPQAGTADPGNGMGVFFGDYNRDGLLDIYSTNMSSTAGTRILKQLYPEASGTEATLMKLAAGNTILKNRGNGTFEDVSKAAGGVGASWGWGGGFLDINNDGWEDVFCTNGFVSGKSKKDT